MKDLDLTIHYQFADMDELPQEEQELIMAAIQATHNSYANYSHFHVGAALRLADGSIMIGANQENAAFPSSLCAERSAIFAAPVPKTRASHPHLGHCRPQRPRHAEATSHPLWRLQASHHGDGRPIPATRLHPALWHGGHLSLQERKRLAALLLRGREHEIGDFEVSCDKIS